MPCRFSTPGREFYRPASFANGASSRCAALLPRCASRFPARESSASRAAPEPSCARYLEAVAVDAVGLDWTVELGFARDQVQTQPAGPGQSRSAGAPGRRRGARSLDRRDPRGICAGAVHFQSRPRHPAGNADRPCRAADRARAQGRSLGARARPGTENAVYEWIKAFHIIAVIAWMAGMLYLPRLFVYHCAAEKGSVQSETFKVMERRLLRGIINPAMIAAWRLGSGSPGSGLILATAGLPRGGFRPSLRSSSAFRRCTGYSPAGSRISPPTATGIRKDSTGLSTKYRRC